MKVCIGYSLAVVLMVALRNAAQADDSCEQSCPDDYSPVCGSDGTIYSNACELRNFQCWDDMLTQVDPSICGLSPATGNSDQVMAAAASPSNCDQACSSDFVPVCGSDGSIYLNECMLQKSQCMDNQLTMVDPSLCGLAAASPTNISPATSPLTGSMASECQLSCATDYTPVCGTDRVTYTNTCALETARCLGASIDIAYYGECVRISTPEQPAYNAGCSKVCSPDNNPVCGTDGVTYFNGCYLEIAMCKDPTVSLASLGSCQDHSTSNGASCDFSCTQEYSPMCGSDGITYSNFCLFQIAQCVHSALQIAYDGSCITTSSTASSGQQDQPPPAASQDAGGSQAAMPSSCQNECTMDYWPLCGSDGVTYNNACVFQVAQCVNNKLQLANQGECKSNTSDFDCDSVFTCTAEFSPVCGSDGTTYPNLCMFRMVQCMNSQLQLAYSSACMSQNNNNQANPTNPNDYCQLQCDQQFDPVCGTDGRTYMSSCELLKAKCLDGTIEEAYEGQCSN